MEETQSELATAVDIDAILATVLRIFAARGRAIREERAEMKTAGSMDANPPDVPGDQEAGSTDSRITR